MFAAPVPMTIGGKQYQARALRGKDYAQIEQHMLGLRPNPIKIVKDNWAALAEQPDLQQQMLQVAMAEACRVKSVSFKDAQEWMDSLEGTVYVTWLQVKQENGSVTLEEIRDGVYKDIEERMQSLVSSDLFREEEAEPQAQQQILQEMQEQLNRASGEDELGNSTGPSSTTIEATGETKKGESSPGDGSADTSPASTT
jgi:hypothetical protein